MGNVTCEIVQIKQLPQESMFCKISLVKLMRDNKFALNITSNLDFH